MRGRRGRDRMVVGYIATYAIRSGLQINGKRRRNAYDHYTPRLGGFELTTLGVGYSVFNAIFNNISFISWGSVLLVEETGENHQPVANH
jgi:hypothetical protein